MRNLLLKSSHFEASFCVQDFRVLLSPEVHMSAFFLVYLRWDYCAHGPTGLTLSSSYNVVWLIYFNTISLRSFRCYGDLINLVNSSSCTVWHQRSTIRTINSWYELGFAKLGGIWQTKNLAVFYIQILKLKYEGFHLVLYCFAWKDTNIPECTSPQKRSRELH